MAVDQNKKNGQSVPLCKVAYVLSCPRFSAHLGALECSLRYVEPRVIDCEQDLSVTFIQAH